MTQSKQSRGRKRHSARIFSWALLTALLCALAFWAGRASASATAVSPSSASAQTAESSADSAPADTAESAALAGAAAVSPEWALVLVNASHPLAEDYAVTLQELSNGHAVDARMYPQLQAMMDAARAEGLHPILCSSYRSAERQKELYEQKVQQCLEAGLRQEEAEAEAALWVAPPGTSEHQTGLAVDIVDEEYQILDEQQEQTPVQQWLIRHCAEYGFILRYPTDKSDVTGIGYEPWHYRYVGEETAAAIMESGLCLEEYLGAA